MRKDCSNVTVHKKKESISPTIDEIWIFYLDLKKNKIFFLIKKNFQQNVSYFNREENLNVLYRKIWKYIVLYRNRENLKVKKKKKNLIAIFWAKIL